MQTVALFRSCLRKEYRDQIIKMLRAVPGEYTRTAYRFQWIAPEVLRKIEAEEEFKVASFLVSSDMGMAVPCRIMTLVEHPRQSWRAGKPIRQTQTDEDNSPST